MSLTSSDDRRRDLGIPLGPSPLRKPAISGQGQSRGGTQIHGGLEQCGGGTGTNGHGGVPPFRQVGRS